ncbi:GntR family transcriptional regulator [Ostreiculturibacter nitratireducens]|uniref:GntR family transcriptional regulator n=1 Tax=Ostreiculturibacter nitratireducens TaxID=3075226 RepID=UPI0031B59392
MSDTPPPSKARKETLTSRIADDLRARILRGELPPGQKINLERLREETAVSVSPLREAVSRLVAEGLVSFEDQRGYAVTPVSSADLAEITHLRGELETMALEDAIAGGDLEWESEVMGTLYRLNRTERDPTRRATMEAWEEAHSAFHVALISGCRQPRLLQICTTLRRLQDRYRRLFLLSSNPDSQRSVESEHRAIAESATSRETARAKALLRAHIEATGAELRVRMEAAERAERITGSG